ncbi:MAG: J domain-containing protein [Bacteroidota bacterium]
MPNDYYQILGISRESTTEQIRRAYRIRAKLLHPDVNKKENSKQLFQLLNEAYQVLINSEKRRWYDFKLKYPSTTGMRPQPHNRSAPNYESYYRAYTQHQQQKKQEEETFWWARKILDNFLFYFLVISGALAIFFGIIQLIDEEEKGVGGVVFGVWFLLLLFYGWNLMNKRPQK